VINKSIQIEKGAPGYAAVNPNTNKIYISYPTSNFILAINLNRGSIDAKIPANSPGNIVVNSVTNKIYASSAYGICEIDGMNNQYEMINIGLPHSDGSVDVNSLTNLLYTTCFGHDILTVIDAATQAIADKIPVGKNPKGVAVYSTENKIYVANYDSDSVSVIDGNKSNNVVDTIKTKDKWSLGPRAAIRPLIVSANELSKLLYVKASVALGTEYYAGTGNQFFVIDMVTGRAIKERMLPSDVEVGFAYNKTSNSIYMSKRGEKAVMKFDAYAKKVLHTITIEKRSFWKRFYEGYQYLTEIIAVNSSTNKVYVSDRKNNLLYEIDG
jgi:YVTN family beta-propeller protein